MASRVTVSASFGFAAVAACTLVWVACSSSSSSGGGSGSSSGGSSSGTSSGTTSSSSGTNVGSSSGTTTSSSSGTNAGSSSGTTGSSSGTVSGDAGCPSTPCATGTCCADIAAESATCQATCATDDKVQCLGSSDCPGTEATDGGACCATALLDNNPDGAAFPYCNVNAITSYCAGSCGNPQIEITCTTNSDASVEKVQVCSQTSDCANSPGGATSCCAVLSYHVCLAPAVATLEKLNCLN